ncbi:MAG: glycosyltransferase family 39 protein [Candidatus Methanoperedens sp.]|nr:glycosyltransferase family 39 protein [Candidatus Methanoperedens sp.]
MRAKKSKIWNTSGNNEKLILLLILLFAVIIRVYNDPTIPYHYDPGKNIVYSRAILETFPFFPQFNQYFNLGEYYEYQILFPYIVALMHKLTGISLVDLTAWSAIMIGSLLVITTYLLSKEIFDNITAALISSGLIALSKIQLFTYMNYYPQITGLMLLPLAFVFIIRYLKTKDKKYIVFASITSGAIILASYISALVYLPILILSLTIYSLIKKDLHIIIVLASIITGTLGLISFYLLPIINRHGIEAFIKGAFDTIFTTKDIPFTNFNFQVSELLLLKTFGFMVLFALVIFILLIIYVLFKRESIKFQEIKYEHILLFLWILISIVLIESYRFRPVLWVDRYIEFLDLPVMIITGYIIYFILNKFKENKYLNSRYTSILILILVFSYPSYEVIKHGYRFGYWNTPNDLDALNYIESTIPSDALVAAPPGITSFWVSAIGGVHVLGGESSQILGEKFDGNSYSDIIINSPNIDEKLDLIRKFGVQYIYITIRPKIPLLWNNDYNLNGLRVFTDQKYFQIIYEKEGPYISSVYFIKVKEDLIPRYNYPKIDKNVTIYGYLISVITLISMIGFLLIDRCK